MVQGGQEVDTWKLLILCHLVFAVKPEGNLGDGRKDLFGWWSSGTAANKTATTVVPTPTTTMVQVPTTTTEDAPTTTTEATTVSTSTATVTFAPATDVVDKGTFWGWWTMATTTAPTTVMDPTTTTEDVPTTTTVSTSTATVTVAPTTDAVDKGSFWGWWTVATTTTPTTVMDPTTTTELTPTPTTTTTSDDQGYVWGWWTASTTSTTEGQDYTSMADTIEATRPTERPKFAVYWNVPTFQCHQHGLDFSRVSEWGLRQNDADEFRGGEIAILYDPGEFPALLSAVAGRSVPRNGGVPQAANLTSHLSLFAAHVDKLIPDVLFSGLAVIDFEHWRPVWRQNWGSLNSYREYSRDLERQNHPFWFSTTIEKEASYRYELAAKTFISDTLRLAKVLRPFAKWGYYGYPFCFNFTPHNNRAACSDQVLLDNDGMYWMFSEASAHYPSLYLKERDMEAFKRKRYIDGRLNESMRVAGDEAPVYPYVWYKYHDTNRFLTREDMVTVLRRPLERGCSGVVIWGASRDVNSRQKCRDLARYLEAVIGPAVYHLQNGRFKGYLRKETDEREEREEEEEEEASRDWDVEGGERNEEELDI